MPIVSVSYSKLYNLGNFENERYEATVALAPGQSPEEAMVEAQTFVEQSRQAAIDAKAKAAEKRHQAWARQEQERQQRMRQQTETEQKESPF